MYHEYLKLGWPVFPVAGPVYAENKEDYKTWKAPLVYWQHYQTELPTQQEIEKWQKQWPLAWVGCSTGPFSNLFVIDIDGEKGAVSLASLQYQLPLTRVAKTQRGHHYFFKWNPRLLDYSTTVSDIKPGIDVRGKGGFIILPSPQSKRSWVCEESLAELPEAFYPLLRKTSEPLPKNWRSIVISQLDSGNRHDSFVRLARSVSTKWPIEDTLMVLLPLAQKVDFEDEATSIIMDIYKRYGGSMEDRRKEVRRWTDQLDKRVADCFPEGIPLEWKERCPAVVDEFERLLKNFEALSLAWEKETSAWADSLAQGAYLHALNYLQELFEMPRSKRESKRQAIAFEEWVSQEKKNVRLVSLRLLDDSGTWHPNVAKVISILGGHVRA